jgi:hypothetical protein
MNSFPNAAALVGFVTETENEQTAAQLRLLVRLSELERRTQQKRQRVLHSADNTLEKQCDKLDRTCGIIDLQRWWEATKGILDIDIRLVGEAFDDKRAPWILYNFPDIESYLKQKLHFRKLLLYVLKRYGSGATKTEPDSGQTKLMSPSTLVTPLPHEHTSTIPHSEQHVRKGAQELSQPLYDDQKAPTKRLPDSRLIEEESDRYCTGGTAKRLCQGFMRSATLIPLTPEIPYDADQERAVKLELLQKLGLPCELKRPDKDDTRENPIAERKEAAKGWHQSLRSRFGFASSRIGE